MREPRILAQAGVFAAVACEGGEKPNHGRLAGAEPHPQGDPGFVVVGRELELPDARDVAG